ncbi:MAG: hypothetical protein R3C18_22830 [Planctomycetaceae bacterium]
MDLQLGTDGNPVIDQFNEEGFVDLTLQIHDLADDGTHYRFHLTASHDNSELGLDVILAKGIKGGFDANMDLINDHVYRQGVRFIRSGIESDRLVSAIGTLYDADPVPKAMVPEESFTAIALHQGDLDFENECVKLKLFGKDGEPFDEDAYYESFFNVDLANRMVYWNEKDPDYRQPLLRALAAQ